MKKEIRVSGVMFCVYLDNEHLGDFDNMVEAQNVLEKEYTKAMNGSHEYKCNFCNEWFVEDQVEHRIEDRSFTAPYGSTFVLGGEVGSVPVCPVCNDSQA